MSEQPRKDDQTPPKPLVGDQEKPTTVVNGGGSGGGGGNVDSGIFTSSTFDTDETVEGYSKTD